jgi:asparagine synthase (glutamine-hydrolysing)
MINNVSKEVKIIMRERYGWKLYEYNNIKVWFCGYQYNGSIDDMLKKILPLLDCVSTLDKDILSWVKNISGHFAIVIETNKGAVAVVDKICTIPIFTAECKNTIFISNHATILKNECKMSYTDLDLSAGLEVYMSGHTIGNKTLYRGIKRLEAGECLLYGNNSISKKYYYTYSPWKTIFRSENQLREEFTKNCINTFKDIKKSIKERQVVVPLSAGNDSRLIASALKEFGVKNVICVSYGRKGNFETPVSKAVAERLGYKWLFLQINMKSKRNFFKSDAYKKYVKDFESYGSIPNIQEIYEVSLLKTNYLIDDDAIIINGNSGDFISGGHVRSISNKLHNNWDKFLNKHYSLWGHIRSPDNDNYIICELEKILSLRIKGPIDFEKYHYAIMECLECIGRQSRMVMNQQRAYEYFGYEWRLPLWSDEMLYFWETVPYKYKVDQYLYIKALYESNWGNVWHDIKVNNKIIRPFLLRWFRLILIIIFIPMGRSKWHRFEKNVLEYFMHPSYALTVTSYLSVLFDRKGHRGAYSWLSSQMIKSIKKKKC